MVYRSGKLDTQWQRSTSRYTFFTMLVLMVLFYYLMKEVTGGPENDGFNPDTDIALLVFFVVIAWICSKCIGKKTQKYVNLFDNSFYTLTESGILCENDLFSNFHPWEEVTWVRRAGSNIGLQLAHGNSVNLILKHEPESRRREALRYIQTHMGKKNDAELIPAPLDIPHEPALQYTATPAQLRETADTGALLRVSRFMSWLRHGLPVLWIAGFIAGAVLSDYGTMVFTMIMLLGSLYMRWRPGGSGKRVNRFRPYTMHTDGKRVLLKQGKCWILLKQPQVEACYRTPHNLLINFGNNVYLGVDPESELPPNLQAPEKEAPAPTKGYKLLLILAATLGAALYAFTFSNTWHLHCVLNGMDPDHRHALALAELPQDSPVAKVFTHLYKPDFRPLLQNGDRFCPVYLCIYMHTGTHHELVLRSDASVRIHETFDINDIEDELENWYDEETEKLTPDFKHE